MAFQRKKEPMTQLQNEATGADSLADFAAMLRVALGDSLAPNATTFLEMMAENCVMEFPYTPPGGIPRVEGRAALAKYLSVFDTILQINSMTEAVVYRTTEPDVVILEFGASGRGVQTGRAYEQRYISVLTLRDGHIAHYRDYWNPLAALEATGGAEAIAQASQGGANP